MGARALLGLAQPGVGHGVRDSIRVVLESVLRNCDGKKVTEAHVAQLAGWKPTAPRTEEIPFVVARIRDQDRDTNINSKYIVDNVEVKGVPDRDISADLRQDLNALTGKPLDSEAADRLDQRLKSEFPNHDVSRRTSRAKDQGHVNVIYVLTKPEWSRWLRFDAGGFVEVSPGKIEIGQGIVTGPIAIESM